MVAGFNTEHLVAALLDEAAFLSRPHPEEDRRSVSKDSGKFPA